MPPPQPGRSVFDAAAREYDAARPSYPAALYDELEAITGPLAGRLVLDWGAGTGISGRQLAARGARVVLLDIGEQMLRYARARDPRAACVLADGNRMPMRTASADLTTFAQSWHWFDKPAAQAEVARVLRPGGYWAAWWNRAAAEREAWFESYLDVVVTHCPGYTWRNLDDAELAPDWTQQLVAAAGQVEPAALVRVPWTRQVPADRWFTDERSKSYFIDLGPAAREAVLAELARIVRGQFPDGQMVVPYLTTLIVARKRGLAA
ncbi:MAG TPA: class I SAM-dependent methyltransferase [Streptosporangiaceae bacterium]|nr:class I SAM-dependent methyltransferase [Streptosporangiaceae bacterium]